MHKIIFLTTKKNKYPGDLSYSGNSYLSFLAKVRGEMSIWLE